MALLPLLIDLYERDRDPFSNLYDQDFAVGLLNNELNRPTFAGLSAPLRSGYLRATRPNLARDSGVSTVCDDKDAFKVNLDVQQFKPEEISVKLTDDFLSIEGKHEERQDKHGYISRQFTRRYKLPPNVKMDAITSHVSSDGVLSVVAPKKVEAIKGERTIPIQRTNRPSLKNCGGGDEKMETQNE